MNRWYHRSWKQLTKANIRTEQHKGRLDTRLHKICSINGIRTACYQKLETTPGNRLHATDPKHLVETWERPIPKLFASFILRAQKKNLYSFVGSFLLAVTILDLSRGAAGMEHKSGGGPRCSPWGPLVGGGPGSWEFSVSHAQSEAPRSSD